MNRIICILAALLLGNLGGCASLAANAGEVYVSTFESDATPPMGAPLCGGGIKPALSVDDPLAARGIVIFPEDQAPIVLVTVEWVGIANASMDRWRKALAEAAGTDIARVSVHVTHPHDAPYVDESVDAVLADQGLGGSMMEVPSSIVAVEKAAAALRESLAHKHRVTHFGHGQGIVKEVASNRRVLGPDGKVKAVRWSATPDPAVRAEPEGTIDPLVRLVSFWDGETPVAALTYYACHPQSKYGDGRVSADFPGLARDLISEELGIPVLHFDGAGGNVTAGKYNVGDIANRKVFAQRMVDGMHAAWTSTTKYPIVRNEVTWESLELALPLRSEVDEAHERAVLADKSLDIGLKKNAAEEIVWLERARAGVKTPVSCLGLGPIRVLHMPGELFIEYQLAAQAMRPDLPVAMAAYGEYGMGYIGTEISYAQGGYETGMYVSRTAPQVEGVLMDAMRGLLGAK